MELRQIKYFMEVAKREHVTEAANALHVAQSAVSRQIFNLEMELGVELFIRKGRRVKLTPIGKIFLERMQLATEVIDNAQKEVKEFLNPEHGTVRIAFQGSIASHVLPQVIGAFRKHYPHAKFQLKQLAYEQLVDAVANGAVNLALIAPLPLQQDENINSTTLFTENIVALLPTAHPLAEHSAVGFDQLEKETFILMSKGSTIRKMIDDACEECNFQINSFVEGNSIDVLKGLVSAGVGITFLPERSLENNNLPTGTIKIKVVRPVLTRTVGVITSKERRLLPTEELFHAFLIKFFSDERK